MEITLNEPQRQFVLRETYGVSYLGFDVIYEYCQELARRIKKYKLLPAGVEPAPVLKSEIGTLEQYNQYQGFLNLIGDRNIGTWFDNRTPTAVRNILEQYRKEDGKLRLFYGDRNTGRCWMEENDVMGRIGRSTGKMKIPLIIEDGERGGPGILTGCIVRIIDAETREELYRQKNYHLPEMEVRPVESDLSKKGYTHGVWVKNKQGTFENHANCRSFGQTAQYAAFLSGDCCEQPT